MARTSLDLLPPFNSTLQARVKELEHELLAAHEQARIARDEAGRAKKSAADAWAFARVLAKTGRAAVRDPT